MVEVFTTNIDAILLAEQVRNKMQESFPGIRINFDIDDCDHILRIEGHVFCVTEILRWLNGQGVVARVLD